MCKFLRISSPYDNCLAYAPYAKNAPHCSRPINKGKKAQVPNQLEDLYHSRVPSRRAANILNNLSSNVVCGITGWHQNKAVEVYQEWCDDLWKAYLYVNDLDPRLWTRETPQFNRRTWEAALENAQQEQRDDSSSEDYDSSEDDYDERNSTERDSTPDTTISSFDESPFHENESNPSQSSHASDRLTIRSIISASSRQSSERIFDVYRDPEVPPVGSLHGEVAQVLQPLLPGSRRLLGPLDTNIPLSRHADRISPWSHETNDSNSSATSSRTESRSSGSNNASQQPGIDAHSSSANNETLLPSVEELSSSDDTAVEIPDTVEEGDDGLLMALPSETEADTDSQYESEVEEAEDGGQDGNNDEEQARVSADGLEINDNTITDSGQDLREERSPRHSTLESEVAATDADRNEDDVTALLALDDSLFDDPDVADAAPVPQALIPSQPGFRLYPQASTPLSQLRQLWNTMTQTVSVNRRHSGFIYAFARPSLPGFLKIGYVKQVAVSQESTLHPVDSRLAKWQVDCGHPITEAFRVEIPCLGVERIESLVHLTLRDSRCVEDPPCRRCERKGRRQRSKGRRGGGKHDEWFEVDEQIARRVVNMWALFAQQLPYDRWGRMVDFWSEKVDEQRGLATEDDTTMNWLERMPQLVEELRRWEFGSIIGPIGR